MKHNPCDQYTHLKNEIQQKLREWREQGVSQADIQKKLAVVKAHFSVFIPDDGVVDEIFESAQDNRTFSSDDIHKLEKRKKEASSKIFGMNACVTRH